MAKRLFDIVISSALLVFLLPLLLVISILVYFLLGTPIFFRQRRVGLNSKIFEIIKFRTMNDKKDNQGSLLPDNLRLTRFGRFLRATSVDELPELWNILRGEMSIVGPRPLLEEYLELYTEEQNKRHLVKPGITGLAQISGRNALSWEDKFKYDLSYVKNNNLLLDLKIILITGAKVLSRSGINSSSETTAEKFRGSDF